MEWAPRRPSDRVGLLAIVLGGHWLLIEVLFGGRLAESRKLTGDPPMSWVWIPATLERPPKQPQQTTNTERRPRRPIAQRAPTEPSAGAPTLAMQPSEPAADNVPDWISEAHSIAQSIAPQLNNELQEKCATAKRLAQALPAGCKKKSFVKDWQPEPQRAGFIGIFPYVRIGRCLIGLGFWGCTVQEPSPDGTLLEDFRDPDRPRSSVPDLPVQTFPQAPRPQAFKPSQP
jgi:hypothetical protein